MTVPDTAETGAPRTVPPVITKAEVDESYIPSDDTIFRRCEKNHQEHASLRFSLDSKAVFRWRILVAVSILGTVVLVIIGTPLLVKGEEHQEFHDAVGKYLSVIEFQERTILTKICFRLSNNKLLYSSLSTSIRALSKKLKMLLVSRRLRYLRSWSC